jgi:hypothetical protein
VAASARARARLGLRFTYSTRFRKSRQISVATGGRGEERGERHRRRMSERVVGAAPSPPRRAHAADINGLRFI